MLTAMKVLFPLLILSLFSACSAMPKKPALRTVDHVDLTRFMGDWYVIGMIPWFVEKDNVGTMDVYTPRKDGRIDVRYVFHKKSLDAPRQEMKALGKIVNPKTNAEWAIQFIWPFWAPYLVIDLSPDYRHTVIGHPSRDLVWIMSRETVMAEADYQAILKRLADQGYDVSRIVRVPQRSAK
jgi:apolipoprotein D and lipocalin family protein